MCGKIIFKPAGFLCVRGNDYVIQKPLCKKDYAIIQQEYIEKEQEENDK